MLEHAHEDIRWLLMRLLSQLPLQPITRSRWPQLSLWESQVKEAESTKQSLPRWQHKWAGLVALSMSLSGRKGWQSCPAATSRWSEVSCFNMWCKSYAMFFSFRVISVGSSVSFFSLKRNIINWSSNWQGDKKKVLMSDRDFLDDQSKLIILICVII